MSDKPIYVAFASPKSEKNFDKLKEGEFYTEEEAEKKLKL
jgi:hypothetical protein